MGDNIELAQAPSSSEASSSSQPMSQRSPNEERSSPNSSGTLNDRAQNTVDSILYPADSYTSDTRTYWADLPFWQKTRWINKQSNEEARRELKVIGQMFKQDPLSPIRSYFSNYVVTGMGLLVEGYVLFSVGNLSTLFKAVWPQCWKTHETCEHGWLIAVDALQITGIIFGQILVGIEGDWIGRRFGMVQDALVLTLGTVMLTAMWGTTLNGWLICYAISLFVYGVGVGGEYPMTSTRAMEGSGTGFAASTGDRMHRGRKVALAFTMQGWGQLLNQGVLLICLLIFHGSLDAPFSKVSTQYTFRVSFGVIILPTLYLAYLRFYKMKYADQALKDAKGRSNTSGYSWKTLKMASAHYWHRMVGTAIVWFINDVLFYGSKIFSGVFIARITAGTGGGSSSTLKTTWLYNLLNVGISLIGYYLGALLIDHKQYGRKWMQINGLLFIGVVFAICAAQWETFVTPGVGTRAFMALYFLSSFFTQFGPNVTSFLLAAELYPALVRSTAHGVSAATGKCGALLAAVLYNYIDDRTKFFVVFPFGFAGALLTLVFVADSTGLDLREQERYYQYVIEGREHEYHGVAVHPRHLSLWERVVLKRHLAYDAEKDRVQKLAELKSLYKSIKADDVSDEKGGQGKGKQGHLSDDQRMLADYELDNFFANEEKLQGYLTRKSGTRQTSKPHPSKLAEVEGKLR